MADLTTTITTTPLSMNNLAPKSNLVLMLGGTFNPVHHGHLRTAVELCQQLPVKQLHLVPCNVPPLKDEPKISAEHRLNMLSLAIQGEAKLLADRRELERPGPSYSLDTLKSLREDYGASQPLGLVIGWDAFANLSQWHKYQELLTLAHLIVVTRPGAKQELATAEAELLNQHRLLPQEDLTASPAGKILRLQLPSQLEISATSIRRLVASNQSARYLLPSSVLNYIQEQQLYSN